MWTSLLDTFNTLDRSKWKVADNSPFYGGFASQNPGFLLCWKDSTATISVNNGDLLLSGIKYDNYTTTFNWFGNDTTVTTNFIAASMETYDYFHYGIFECNMTCEYKRGTFPAFWLYSQCSVSKRTEIDIMEFKYEDSSPEIEHGFFYYPDCNDDNIEGPGHDQSAYASGTHTYKCIYMPDKVEFYIDNNLKHTVTKNILNEYWYPDMQHHIILSHQLWRYNTTAPYFGVQYPQTTKFHWISAKTFFLAPEITSPNVICSTGTSVMDVDSRADNITWSLTPTNLFSGSTTGAGKNATIAAASGANGEGKITYTFKMPSDEIFTAEKTFWVGKPNNAQIDMMVMFGQSPYNILCTNMEQTIAAGHPNVQQQGIDKFYWDFGSWASYHTGFDFGGPAQNSRPTFYLYGYPPSSQVIKAAAHNQCGHDESMIYAKSKTFYAQNCFGYFLTFSPNPAGGDETTLTIESDSKEVVFDESSEWELEIFDQVQTLKEKKTKLKGKEHKIQTTGWKEGVYMVRVKYNPDGKSEEILQGKLVVKK